MRSQKLLGHAHYRWPSKNFFWSCQRAPGGTSSPLFVKNGNFFWLQTALSKIDLFWHSLLKVVLKLPIHPFMIICEFFAEIIQLYFYCVCSDMPVFLTPQFVLTLYPRKHGQWKCCMEYPNILPTNFKTPKTCGSKYVDHDDKGKNSFGPCKAKLCKAKLCKALQWSVMCHKV